MKIKKLKYLAVVFCFSICFLFAGCANITYSIIMSDDYTILQQLSIDLDVDKLQNISVDDLKSEIENYVVTHSTNMTNSFRSNLISYGINNPDKMTLITLMETAVKSEYKWYGNTLIYSIQFSAVEDSNNDYIPVENVYYFYYTGEFEPDFEDDVNKQYEKGVFIDKYSEITTTSFDSELCAELEQAFLDDYSAYGYTIDDVNYIYQYGQKYSRLHSDADEITYKDGVYIHTWNLDSKEDEITFYRIYAKPIAWYVIALICGFLAVIIYMTVVKIRSKKANQNLITDVLGD